ncbi:MAG: YcjF family protein, partial [Syntrophothermus sp.]
MEEKELTSKKIVKNYMWWSMGAGLIPVPFVDLAAVSGVQLKMLKDMAEIYDIKFAENKGKSIVSALLGSIIPNSLSAGNMGSLLKMIPLVGPVLGGLSMSIFSGAATYA